MTEKNEQSHASFPTSTDAYAVQPHKRREIVKSQNGLTLGKLRELLSKNESLADDTPIFYQRIEDLYFHRPDMTPWHVNLFPWESRKWTEKTEDEYIAYGIPYRIASDVNGAKYIVELNQYIGAHDAVVLTDENAQSAICLNAHY